MANAFVAEYVLVTERISRAHNVFVAADVNHSTMATSFASAANNAGISFDPNVLYIGAAWREANAIQLFTVQ